jgi:hypothetical protein
MTRPHLVLLILWDSLVQVLEQGVHVDPVNLCTLADVFKTRDCTPNAPHTVPEKDIDRAGVLADHIVNWHFRRDSLISFNPNAT